MGNIQSKSPARKMVREAQARANEERAQRDRANVDDMATFSVARTRLAGVDYWQAERVAQSDSTPIAGAMSTAPRVLRRSHGSRGGVSRLRRSRLWRTSRKSEVRSYLKAASAAGRAQGGAAQVAPTQALGGEQAEEHGGGSAPIGDAGDVDAPVV
jgi:hypothetical protein